MATTTTPADKTMLSIAIADTLERDGYSSALIDLVEKSFRMHAELSEMLYTLLPCAEESDEFNKPAHKIAPKVRALIAKLEGATNE